MPAIPGGNPVPLGKVTVTAAGTPEVITKNFTDLTSAIRSGAFPVKSIHSHALPGNTGQIFIGKKNLVKATGVGVLFELDADQKYDLFGGDTQNLFNLLDFWIDAGTSADGAYIFAVKG